MKLRKWKHKIHPGVLEIEIKEGVKSWHEKCKRERDDELNKEDSKRLRES